METRTSKQAISLIVLVITIIVMIILTGTIILTLDGIGVIPQAKNAVKDYDLAEVQTLAGLKWSEAYLDEGNIEEYILRELAEEGVDIDKYDILVEEDGVIVTLSSGWIVDRVDTVPIPKGFVASSATGESTKNGGLVIYEGTEQVNDSNVEDAKRTRNQYVWVPVEDFSKFVRGAYTTTTYSNTLGTDNWEITLDTARNMPLAVQDTNYITSTTLAEVQAMYESVKKYKGFYISRYEAGINYDRSPSTTTIEYDIYAMMGKIPYNFIPWSNTSSMNQDAGGAVEVARKMYQKTNNEYGVISTLPYGVQWDRTLAWWLESRATDVKGNEITSLENSVKYGNYTEHVIASGDLNAGAKVGSQAVDFGSMSTTLSFSEISNYTKPSGTSHALTTGALKTARVNNIYDMAGNMHEWTMEGCSTNARYGRGGAYNNSASTISVITRGYVQPNKSYINFGFRTALYIKK